MRRETEERSCAYASRTAGRGSRGVSMRLSSTSPHTAMQSGAGLGLSITKLIVDRSEGEVFFEDRDSNQGASCCILLPIEASN
jgi:signal transduction histidine kinase